MAVKGKSTRRYETWFTSLQIRSLAKLLIEQFDDRKKFNEHFESRREANAAWTAIEHILRDANMMTEDD